MVRVMKIQRMAVVVVLAALFVIGNASAQVLFTTTNDFGQFNGGAVTVDSTYYSESSTVNGIGNTSDAGGVGTPGALQLTAAGAWGPNGSSWWPGATYDLFQAIDPGGARPWSAESGYGAGTVIAHSGVISFDLYTGNLTDWFQPGIHFNYDGNWWVGFETNNFTFVGADGRTWTHYDVPFTLNARPGDLSYFGVSFAENSGGGNAGLTYYVDNIQVVPEPGTFALLGLGVLSLFFVVRRRVS